MFNSLSDFSHTHYDSNDSCTTYFTPLSDRTVSIGLADDVYVISSNNPLYDPASPSNLHSWDDTLTISDCADDLQTALEIATYYATNAKICWDADLLAWERLQG